MQQFGVDFGAIPVKERIILDSPVNNLIKGI